MPIPTEVVGSLPRPTYLQTAIADYDAGKITKADLKAHQDKAVEDSIKGMEAAGQTVVTDGEQRASRCDASQDSPVESYGLRQALTALSLWHYSFATYPITDTLAGTGLMEGLLPAGQFFAIFEDGHTRQLPGLGSDFKKPFKYKTYAYENLKLSKPFATHPVKSAVIAASMLYLLYPLKDEDAIPSYTREVFLSDLVNESEKDIRGCFAAGAVRVSIDFTEGRLATKNDPRNPWTGAGLLQKFIDLNNRVLDRFSAEERTNIGIHTCPGGDCDSVHSKEVPYHNLLGPLFQMNAGYFLIQCASESEKLSVYKEIGKTIRKDANGVKQIAFIGVTDPLNPVVETAEQVCAALCDAAKFISPDQLGATDDCGFSPFSIDVKPKHGGPDFARDVAFKKIAARNAGAKLAAAKLGL